MKNHFLISCLAFLLVLPAEAQKRRTPASGKRRTVTTAVEEPSRFDQMLDNTQKIMFIDSMVVDKPQFLKQYKMTAEAGAIVSYKDFFQSTEQPYSIVYVNQLGNKCWYAINGGLYTSDRLGHQWSEPSPLEGLGTFQRTNYPFMLADGTTLYFAAIDPEGLGGLDIYVSRYDSESGKFLLAENLGLPFNSEANDYMYAVDEVTGIGYFATDRRQPEGKVCIYTFIPNQKRMVYQKDEIGEDNLKKRARIDCIADTWGDGKDRQEALSRMDALSNTSAKSQKKHELVFIVNDELTYTQMSDFHNPDNQDRMNELLQMRNQIEKLSADLEQMRNHYHKVSDFEKNSLKDEILACENKYLVLSENIHILEKQIRSNEINSLKP